MVNPAVLPLTDSKKAVISFPPTPKGPNVASFVYSEAKTITFRDTKYSPQGGGGASAPFEGGIFETREILMIASNCSISTSTSITVFTANNTSDSLSNTSIWEEKTSIDLRTGVPIGWFGGDTVGGGGGSTYQSGTLGLCFEMDLPIENNTGWVATADLIDLVWGRKPGCSPRSNCL